MIPDDFNNANMVKEWSDHYKPKTSLGTKILVGGIGLSALVGSYFTIPQFNANVNHLAKGIKRTLENNFNYFIKVPNFEEVIVQKGMTLKKYGQMYGLKNEKLRDWKRFVILYNSVFERDPERRSIDKKGNLSPGKKLYLPEP